MIALEEYVKQNRNILQSVWNGFVTSNAISLDT